MQLLEVSGAVQHIYVSLGGQRLKRIRRDPSLYLKNLKWRISNFSNLAMIHPVTS
jgi:hypothetical protein